MNITQYTNVAFKNCFDRIEGSQFQGAYLRYKLVTCQQSSYLIHSRNYYNYLISNEVYFLFAKKVVRRKS